MSIQLVNLHEHEIVFSYTTYADKDSKYKYETHGWYYIKKMSQLNRKWAIIYICIVILVAINIDPIEI